MDSTTPHGAQLQGNTKNTYQSNDLRHAKMLYKRIHEAARMLDSAKLNYQRAVGKLCGADNERLTKWVNHHKD